MTQSEVNHSLQPGLLRDLLNRRFPQILGFYLGGSWGVLQFLDWIVERYLLSPLLVDLSLTIVASLLPSIAVLAYCHGKPGKNKWHKSEKILVPVNILLTVALVIGLFGHKNLDSIARRVSVTDESGKEIVTVVPKKNAIKELALFYFDNQSGKEELNWLQHGLVNILEFDLAQDPFISTQSPFYVDPFKGHFIYQKFRDAGFPEAVKTPVMLQKKIAAELNSAYFMSGTIKKDKEKIVVIAAIYLTQDNSTVAVKTLEDSHIFPLIDEMTLFIKKSLKLPSYKNSKIVDLPIQDMYTHSEKAARLAVDAEQVIMTNNDYKNAQKYLEDAVNIDPTFTLAYSKLSEIYALNNQSEKWKSTYKVMMKHIYKLPEKMQMQTRAGYYLTVKGDPEKAESLLKMIIKLYPNDIKNYIVLAQRYYVTGNFDKAILNYHKILEMDPDRFEVYDKLGKSYENISDYMQALKYYKKYSEKFPQNVGGLLKIGNIEEKLGHFDAAVRYYDQALLLDPEKTSTMLMVAKLDMKTGDYDSALKKLNEALEIAKNPREKSSIYSSLEDYYRLRGQTRKAGEMLERIVGYSKQYLPPLQVLIIKVVTADQHMQKTNQKEIKAMLDKAKSQLSAPFDRIVSIGYIGYYIKLGDYDAAEKYLPDIDEFIKQTGNKQIQVIADKKRAEIWRYKGEYQKAIPMYEKVLHHKKDDLKVMVDIAQCFDKTGNTAQGLQYLDQALKLSPFDPRVNYNAGQLYAASGQQAKAVNLLQRALRVWEGADADFEPARKAQELLKQLTKESNVGQ